MAGLIDPIVTVPVTGDLNTFAAGTVTPGSLLVMSEVERGTLSATLVVDAETNTLTITGGWQASNDGTTWVDVYEGHNPARVALATGTGGADAEVTRCLTAPHGVYGFRYARAVVVNGVATGAAADTYSIQYNYGLPFWG